MIFDIDIFLHLHQIYIIYTLTKPHHPTHSLPTHTHTQTKHKQPQVQADPPTMLHVIETLTTQMGEITELQVYIARIDGITPKEHTPEEYEARVAALGVEGYARAGAVWRAAVWAGSQGGTGACGWMVCGIGGNGRLGSHRVCDSCLTHTCLPAA